MNIEDLRDFCLSLSGTTEGFPFGEQTLVFKVKDKVFLLTPLDTEILQFNAKCNPETAQELREQFECVLPGYHMNKKHWNTVLADGSVNDEMLKSWIRDSYDLVVATLPARVRADLL
ncbi:MmcQ/YjbR family DNA-binding protein [Persicitalea jodogahamensis]|uniref:MmcQ-like protein n=1 Tax=Persicitalea jodogahamensis TaxID=402147 RepID=A0A8J3DE21_9BACT|nr:MmcQ/YjbR family DNA-binding protein [Persicitalea jodogahamensis]GHB81994.1 hypothetical protein GCM10007390_41240 [Persicitalea jodogahamensis]